MKRSQAGTATPTSAKPTPKELRIDHDTFNESVVIAAAIVDEEARDRLVNAIPVDAFYGKGHPEIWEVVRELKRKKLSYDPLTVQQLSGGTVDAKYLEFLIRERPAVPPNLDHHISALMWDRTRIEAARGPIQTLLENLRDPQADPERVRSLARRVGDAFAGKGFMKFLRDPHALVAEVKRNLDRRRAGEAVYPYGIDGFDIHGDGPNEGQYRVIPGAAPCEMTVITGNPGSGKSTVISNMVLGLLKQGRSVLYGAWEQQAAISLELLAIIDLGYSKHRVLTGQLTDAEVDAYMERIEELAAGVRFMSLPTDRKKRERGQRVNEAAMDTIRSYIAETSADAFIGDLFRYALTGFDPEEEEDAIKESLAIGKDENCHMVLVQQQRSKDVEARDDKRPTRDGVKGTSAWVEVPGTIIGCHMPSLWKAVPRETIELILLKQRFAKGMLAVEFDFDPDKGKLEGGRGIEYLRSGEMSSIDAFLSEGGVPKGWQKERVGGNSSKGKRRARG